MFKRLFLFISILVLLIFFAVIQAEPADLEVKSSVDKNKVGLNEIFNFRIDITGDITESPDIKLPDFKENFNLLSSGQSQRISFKDRQAHLAITYEFILQPKEVGKFTIEETEIKFKGKLYKTQSIDIEAIPASIPKSLPDERKEKPPLTRGISI